MDVFEGVLDSWGEELPYDRLLWQGSPDARGVFSASGFDPGTYTVVVSISNPTAVTQSEGAFSSRQVATTIELAEDSDAFLEFPLR